MQKLRERSKNSAIVATVEHDLSIQACHAIFVARTAYLIRSVVAVNTANMVWPKRRSGAAAMRKGVRHE